MKDIGEQYRDIEPVVRVEHLSLELAERYINRLVELANHIPEVTYVADELLAESKPDGRIMKNKWQHSYILFEDEEVVGFIMGYERTADGTLQYPVDSLYMSELVIDESKRGRGYARVLIARYLSDAVDAARQFTLQTNAAAWNEPVQKLYESFGFRVDGEKLYDNRSDVIMRATAADVKIALSDRSHHVTS